MAEREPPGWVMGLVVLAAVTAGVWGMWCTIIGFVGGTMPIIGYETEGSLGLGLFMFFIGEPLLLTVAYWATMLVFMPVAMIFSRTGERKQEEADQERESQQEVRGRRIGEIVQARITAHKAGEMPYDEDLVQADQTGWEGPIWEWHYRTARALAPRADTQLEFLQLLAAQLDLSFQEILRGFGRLAVERGDADFERFAREHGFDGQ